MSNSHFYHPSTGDLIDGGLREARKLSPLPYPSPTTVLQLLRSEGLIRYLQRQAWESGVTTPRNPGESDDDYYDRCCHYADEHALAARTKGGTFHTLVQSFHLSLVGAKPPPFVPPHLAQMYEAYLQWYEKYVAKTLYVEHVVIGQGYAGRLDHCCLLKDGRVAVTDIKTQDITKRKRFNHYTEWALQLAAYAGALKEATPKVLISVCVSVDFDKPILEAYCWPGDLAYYHVLFLSLLEIWKMDHNYWPVGLMDEKEAVIALEEKP